MSGPQITVELKFETTLEIPKRTFSYHYRRPSDIDYSCRRDHLNCSFWLF